MVVSTRLDVRNQNSTSTIPEDAHVCQRAANQETTSQQTTLLRYHDAIIFPDNRGMTKFECNLSQSTRELCVRVNLADVGVPWVRGPIGPGAMGPGRPLVFCVHWSGRSIWCPLVGPGVHWVHWSGGPLGSIGPGVHWGPLVSNRVQWSIGVQMVHWGPNGPLGSKWSIGVQMVHWGPNGPFSGSIFGSILIDAS